MYGTDVSPVALKAAAERGYVVELAEQDSSGSIRRPFPRLRFDVVILSAVLEHVFEPAVLLAHAYAALKDGGCVVVLTPNVTWLLNRILFVLDIWDHPLLGGTSGHIRYLNKHMLERMMREVGFRNLDWSYSPIVVLPPDQDLFVRDYRLRFLRRWIGKRARRWPSLFAENLIVLGYKPIVSRDVAQWAVVKQPDRIEGLRVLHIAGTASGAHWMFEILRELRMRGYEVSALISGTQGDLAGKLEREGIPYYVGDLDVLSPGDLVSIVRKILRLARFLREHRFDIVHYHLFASVILGRAAAWVAEAPLRISMITGPYYLEAPAAREIELRSQWMDTRVIASCEYTRTLYVAAGVQYNRVGRVYYGADGSSFRPSNADPKKLRRELGIRDDSPIVGMVAYFYAPLPPGPWTPPHLQNRAVKGHETFLQAAQIVRRKNRKVKFLLVGEGWSDVGKEYEKELRSLVGRMGLGKSVIFTGARSDIPDVLASFDVSVQCALSENLGGTIESLLMARPTIATKVGGMVDSVRHEHTGLLVPPDDSKALAEAILRLLESPSMAKQLGINGRKLMLEEFSLAKTVDDIDRLYQSLASEIVGERRGSISLGSHYYRSHRSILNAFILSLRWSWYFLRRDIVHTISSQVRSITKSLQRIRGDPMGTVRGLAKSLKATLGRAVEWSTAAARRFGYASMHTAPLLLPYAVILLLLPPMLQMMLLAVAVLGFISLRVIYRGPMVQLIRLLSKRLFDILFSMVILAVTSPVWALVTWQNRKKPSGPLLKRMKRIGRFGLPFEMFVFRTGVDETEAEAISVLRQDRSYVKRHDKRLNGLPSLLNVLRGDMSLVGPAPTFPGRVDHCTSYERRRLEVKPGVVDLARTRRQDPVDSYAWYADHWSFWTDLHILLKALFKRGETGVFVARS